MIDKKLRIKLRSLASTIKPTVWIGKDGISENVLNQIKEELFNHELIKISLQESAPEIQEEELQTLEDQLACDVVTKIGNKIVLYKVSEKKNIKHVI